MAFDRLAKGQQRYEIWVLPMTGEHKPFAFLASQFDERSGGFSPDGKWMAYCTNASGQFEVNVTDFPEARTRFQISNGGGLSPKWRADGKELFFLDAEGRITAADIEVRGNTLLVGDKRTLAAVLVPVAYYGFNVSRDGKNFLVNKDPASNLPLVLITDWDATLGKK